MFSNKSVGYVIVKEAIPEIPPAKNLPNFSFISFLLKKFLIDKKT